MKLFKKKVKKTESTLLDATTLKAYREDYLNKVKEREKARTKNWVETKLAPYITTLAKAGANGHDCLIPDDVDKDEVVKMLKSKNYTVDYFGGNSISIYW